MDTKDDREGMESIGKCFGGRGGKPDAEVKSWPLAILLHAHHHHFSPFILSHTNTEAEMEEEEEGIKRTTRAFLITQKLAPIP